MKNILLTPDAASSTSVEIPRDTNGRALPARITADESVETEVNSLGVDFKVNVPKDIAAFDKNAAAEGRCLAEATNNIIYRGFLPEFRKAFVPAVAKESGIEREMIPDGDKTEETTNADGTKVKVPVMKPALSVGKDLNKVYAELGLEDNDAVQSRFGELAQTIANDLVFDAAKVEREAPTPKKTPQVYLDAAKNLIDQGKGAVLAAKLTDLLKPAVAFDATVESLGKAIQLNEARKAAEARKAVAASYGDLASA